MSVLYPIRKSPEMRHDAAVADFQQEYRSALSAMKN
jgi:hypothetical protein